MQAFVTPPLVGARRTSSGGGLSTAARAARLGVEVLAWLVVAAWAFGIGPWSAATAGPPPAPPAFWHGENDAPQFSTTPMCFDAAPATLDKYAALTSTPYRSPDIAVDVLYVRAVEREGVDTLGFDVVLCNRSRPPPLLAIPGGYAELGEPLEETVARELLEETGIDVGRFLVASSVDGQTAVPPPKAGASLDEIAHTAARRMTALDGYESQPRLQPWGRRAGVTGQEAVLQMRHFGSYARPRRDKRRHTASIVYLLLAPVGSPAGDVAPKGRDDVKHCQFWPMERVVAEIPRRPASYDTDVDGMQLTGTQGICAFDHGDVLTDAFEALQRNLRAAKGPSGAPRAPL